jgi:hypothetical protein
MLFPIGICSVIVGLEKIEQTLEETQHAIKSKKAKREQGVNIIGPDPEAICWEYVEVVTTGLVGRRSNPCLVKVGSTAFSLGRGMEMLTGTSWHLVGNVGKVVNSCVELSVCSTAVISAWI